MYILVKFRSILARIYFPKGPVLSEIHENKVPRKLECIQYDIAPYIVNADLNLSMDPPHMHLQHTHARHHNAYLHPTQTIDTLCRGC